MCVPVQACTFLHTNCCVLIQLASPEPLFAGTRMGARPVVWQFPMLFIVKKVNQSVGVSGSEGKGYLQSTGEGRGDKRWEPGVRLVLG